MKVEPNYIERDFAKLDDLIAEMKNSDAVLYFCGPSGTGKSTTLNQLYKRMQSADQHVRAHYVNARFHDKLGVPANGAYIFVDEAQCLKENKTLCVDIEGGEAYCLAFSPVISTNAGDATSDCPFRYTEVYNFRPYSEREVTELETKANVNKECIKEARKVGVLFIPRMLNQCKNCSDVRRWINREISNLLSKLRGRLTSEDYQDGLCAVLLKAAMGDTLNEVEEGCAIDSGFFYVDESDDVHLVYPRPFMVRHLYKTILSIHSLMKGFNTGMAFEFLVYAKLQIDGSEIRCMGDNPSSLAESADRSSHVNARPRFQIGQCDECINQSHFDELKPSKSWCLVKLRKEHYAVDFLVIGDPHGTASKKLFFVQASVQKYQDRTERKLSSVYDEIDGGSVLHFYSQKLDIRPNQCFYVYACPEIPEDKRFSRQSMDQNKVYFLQVK